MNRFLLSSLLGLALLPMVGAAPSNTNTVLKFENNTRITDPTKIPLSVVNFINRGSIDLSTTWPFETFDTLNVTNRAGTSTGSGIIKGSPGFRFDLLSSADNSRRQGASFFNDNNARVEAVDNLFGFESYIPMAMVGHSELRIWSTNITVKSGTPVSTTEYTRASLITGANGLMELWGKNVDLSRSGLEVLPVWNESSGSLNDFDNGYFFPDLAIHDQASSLGAFGPGNKRLYVQSLWDGTQASSMSAPPAGILDVPSFTLTNPEGDFYFTGDPDQRGTIAQTNYIPSFEGEDFIPTATNQVIFITNVVTVPTDFLTNIVTSTNEIIYTDEIVYTNEVVYTNDTYVTNQVFFTNIVSFTNEVFFTNQVYVTNLFVDVFSQTLQVGKGFNVTNVASILTNTYTILNPYAPTNGIDSTNAFLYTNTIVFGNVFRAEPNVTYVTVYTNSIKGAFFGEAPPGFTIAHGFFGNGVEPATIQAVVSVPITNAVTGLPDVASILVQDSFASDPATRVLLDNYLTTALAPAPPTTRPGNYLVSRGGQFATVIGSTNTGGQLDFFGLTTENRLPESKFFTEYGIEDTNNPIFYDPNHTATSFMKTPDLLKEVGNYAAYQAFVDNVVEREVGSPDASFTNLTGKVIINADNLNLEKTRIRGEGSIRIETPHLISSTNTVIDCENLSFDLASTNGTLRIQSLTKENVERLRGSISVWSAQWSSDVTVVFNENYALTNGTVIITNSVGTNDVAVTNLVQNRVRTTNVFNLVFHTLMLDARSLTTTLPVTVYDLAARSPNVILEDNITLAQSLYLSGKSFTIDGRLTIPGVLPANPITGESPLLSPLQDWTGAMMPNLAFFTNNGSLNIPGEAHFGDDRPSPFSAFVNTGELYAYSLQLNSGYFENRGQIFAGNLVSTNELFDGFTNFITTFQFGAALEMRGGTGFMIDGESQSGAETVFFCRDLVFSNYFGYAGGAFNFNVTNRLTDFGPDSQNLLEALNGFNLWVKPKTGDLLGTTLVSLAPDVPTAQPVHTWAGEDRGPSPAGFSNNVAIGTLILAPDFSVASIDPLFIFRGTGARNALYVDLLDLSYLSDYASQLLIDPNLTIYFAAANLGFTPPDGTNGLPQTPEEFLDGQFDGRLRWVSSYAGPNSSATVEIDGQPITVNSGLAQSWSNQGIDPASVLHLAAVNIEVYGNGTVSPYYNGQLLIVGQTNTITAQPGEGATFLGWTGSFESTSPQLTFVAEPDLVLIAQFTYSPTAASYNGLFFDTNGVQVLQSGAITITTTKSGKYSGSVQVGSKRYPFTGQLDEGGADARYIPKTPWFIAFQTEPDKIVGTIGEDGSWLANLTADRATFNAKTNPAPFAGQYTLIFPGSGDSTNTQLPYGSGYGTVKVDESGKVRFSGMLADGTKVSQSAIASAQGFWPFYLPLYAEQGQVLGWLEFRDTGDRDLGGQFSWIKSASAAKFYPDGFQIITNAIGSVCISSNAPITGFTEAVVSLMGGDLETPLNDSIFISSLNKVSSLEANKFSLIFKPTGLFKGKRLNPFTGKPIKFNGVILQKQGFGSGYFLGTNATSGGVFLAPPLAP